MLRVIRLRLLGQPPGARIGWHRSLSRPAVVTQVIEPQYEPESEAGPSRLPYNPASSMKEAAVGSCRNLSTQSLRSALYALGPSSFHRPELLEKDLLPSFGPLSELSRLDFHILLHHLIRQDQALLAASLIDISIQHGLSRKPKRRKQFSLKTLLALASSLPSPAPPASARVLFRPRPSPSPDPHAPIQPSTGLRILLDLLRSMQAIRHPRPPQLYEYLIRQSIAEGSPDVAARIFVGLVEEWVTEGRIAEGAEVDDFHPGGGPPREVRKEVSAQLKSWWKGVRTWTLPGEVISPHDRLDLWHPENLLLGEKMRNFPYLLATSPPSAVPEPRDRFLTMILSSLHLDPALASPRNFAASMRALAILANTVLSRTLPVLSLKKLITAFQSTPSSPPIYPANMSDIPASDKWAYEAYTQIHLALQSLFFSLPISSSSLNVAHAHAIAREGTVSRYFTRARAAVEAPSYGYGLRPLSWNACMQLVRYAFDTLGQPKILHSLVQYLRVKFRMGGERPAFWNLMFRGASKTRDNDLAQVAEDALFNKTPLGKTPPAAAADSEQVGLTRVPGPAITFGHADPMPVPEPNAESIHTLVRHLGVTSQFDRLETVVQRLLPSLEAQPTSKDEEASMDPQAPGIPCEVYVALLGALERGRKPTIAAKVFDQALLAEQYWMAAFREKHGASSPVPESLRLPIDAFTSMLMVWENETRITANLSRPAKSSDSDRAGWASYAASRALGTYHVARSRWQDAQTEGLAQMLVPDERFFDAAISTLARRWKLNEPKRLFANQRTEVAMVISDMDDYGVEVPEALRNRLWASNPELKDRKLHVQALERKEYRVAKKVKPEKKEREFAAVLAEMQLAGMSAMGIRNWDDTRHLLEDGSGSSSSPSARV